MGPPFRRSIARRIRCCTERLRTAAAMVVVQLLLAALCGALSTCGNGGGGQESGPSSADLRADAGRTAAFVQAGGQGAATVALDATASTGGRITAYQWFAGNDLIASGATAEVLLAPGVYDITLLVTGASGERSSDQITIEVESTTPAFFSLVIGISGGGQTIPSAGTSQHPANMTVVLAAVPSEGYQFVRWSGDVHSEEAQTMLFMDADKAATAEFVPEGADRRPRFFLPWAAGQVRYVSQGNDGSFSHRGLFAWDFPARIGTPVLAAKAGRVVDVLDTTLRNGAGPTEFSDPANFVTIDHGLGVQSVYAHLDYAGVTVVRGQHVVRGQVIGFACDTGFSTAPHLHFEGLDVRGRSISTGFYEVASEDGIPRENETVISGNALSLATLDEYTPSALPADAFLENGIELSGDPSPAFFYSTESEYQIGGRVLDGNRRVCLALVDPESFETVFCELTEVADDGSFSIGFRFPEELAGRYFLGVISGDGGAEGLAPIGVLLSPPENPAARPIAIIEAPAVADVDFFESRPLIGSHRLTAVPAAGQVTYQWMQVSGPPAVIADPTAATTEFTLAPGEGIERVSFQLVVHDGGSHSLPAQVDFMMPDTFLVTRSGISEYICQPADACPLFDPPPALVSLSTETIAGWVELLNAQVDDRITFDIHDPAGNVVRTGQAAVTSDPGMSSFWQFSWSSVGLVLAPGVWTGIFERNGAVEAVVEFRVMP